ncbi:MAG: tRNA dihydrouridine synthase DusB [Spirochaetales bacterium]|uniref:tRNA-dihydrouridine synthase n=1 Tax=Candidatus Thalassospirochaeta sargassi TaxID=3119039 RepID=A0AAJ1I9P8_9SPIO|nr:tRNA dihydrouridine synthase DusB [Spirochaetales bacterium]
MTHLYHDIELPGRKIPGNLFLAPIAGFSDAAFRSICIDKGASMGFTEMVSCDGLIYNSEKTVNLMQRAPNEEYFAVQVFTAKPEIALKSVPTVLRTNPDVIDLNCGCPVPKVVKNGAGSALMKDLPLLADVVSALVEGASASDASVPPAVSVKIRSGWDSGSLNYIEAAETAVKAGAAMVSLHSRTRVQGYSGKANWEHLKKLKEAVDVPVIGSGDLFSPEAAVLMLEQTGCDGLMFSRGSLGNPWIFEQTRALAEHRTPPTMPAEDEKILTALAHLELAAGFNGETKACREMKKHLCSYTKGNEGAAALRNRIVHSASLAEYREILKR